MLRRDCIGLIGATLANPLAEKWRQALDLDELRRGEDPALELKEFTVPSEALRDGFRQHNGPYRLRPSLGSLSPNSGNGAHEPRTRLLWATAPWDGDRTLEMRYTMRTYEDARETEDADVRLAGLRSTAFQCTLPDDPSKKTPSEDLHRYVIWDWFGDPDSMDGVTDWVETEWEETESPRKRTDAAFRIPAIYQREQVASQGKGDARPYWEKALSVATTEWGAVSVDYQVFSPEESWQSLDVVKELVDGKLEKAQEYSLAPDEGVR